MRAARRGSGRRPVVTTPPGPPSLDVDPWDQGLGEESATNSGAAQRAQHIRRIILDELSSDLAAIDQAHLARLRQNVLDKVTTLGGASAAAMGENAPASRFGWAKLRRLWVQSGGTTPRPRAALWSFPAGAVAGAASMVLAGFLWLGAGQNVRPEKGVGPPDLESSTAGSINPWILATSSPRATANELLAALVDDAIAFKVSPVDGNVDIIFDVPAMAPPLTGKWLNSHGITIHANSRCHLLLTGPADAPAPAH